MVINPDILDRAQQLLENPLEFLILEIVNDKRDLLDNLDKLSKNINVPLWKIQGKIHQMMREGLLTEMNGVILCTHKGQTTYGWIKDLIALQKDELD